MRGKINLEDYRRDQGIQPAAAPEREEIGSASDPYQQAKEEASKFLHANYQEILSDPRENMVKVDSAIAQAVAQVKLMPDQARRLREELRSGILGAGALQKFLDDPAVTEVMVVGREVRLEKGGKIMPALPLGSSDEAAAIAEDLAQKVGQRFQRARPTLNITWSDGSRINLVHPSLCPKGACITIRKRDLSRPLELSDLVAAQALSQEISDLLVRAVRGRLNVLVSGSTGSGKTTLLRALANATFDDPNERVLVLEDTEELRLRHPHAVPLVAMKSGDSDSGIEVTLHDLFVNALRMRPDRIVIGEVRSVEALDAIEAAKTEHGGLIFTMHLRRPEELGPRMFWISQNAGMGIQEDALTREVHSAVDLIVHLDKLRDGRRRVTRVCEPIPSGMKDLFHWDAKEDSHTQVGDFTDERRAWMEDVLSSEV
jgi:pilus assembly protein CpaF